MDSLVDKPRVVKHCLHTIWTAKTVGCPLFKVASFFSELSVILWVPAVEESLLSGVLLWTLL